MQPLHTKNYTTSIFFLKKNHAISTYLSTNLPTYLSDSSDSSEGMDSSESRDSSDSSE